MILVSFWLQYGHYLCGGGVYSRIPPISNTIARMGIACFPFLPGDADLQARQPFLGARAIAIGGGERAAEAGDRLAGLA